MIKPSYETKFGKAFVGDSLVLLDELLPNSIDLIITSPPFALLRQKSYGNKEQSEYVEWLSEFGKKSKRILKDTGSFVIDLGGAYERGSPIRSIYNYRVLLKFVDELGFFLAEEFFWHNPSKLPSPIEWVNKRKIRTKDSVNTIWWFSKTHWPKANTNNVLVPYSDRMKKLLKDPDAYYDPKKRPSGHNISGNFSRDNGGAIPSNLLVFPNSESNSVYLSLCKENSITPHPARFPSKLPEFFIKFLTDKNDTVLDIFAGSNTTGEVAESLERKWLSFEIDSDYVEGSKLRFQKKIMNTCDKSLTKILKITPQSDLSTSLF